MRVKNAFRNSLFSVMSQIILILVGFFSQRTMNLRMGEDLVGMNSVISNVLALLSVSELGIATAVVFHLYGALASKNEKEIASLMNLYRRAYRIFAAVILGLGLCTLPFIHLCLKNNSYSVRYIRIVFLLWLIRTVLSYLLSYKRSVLIADQREYVVSIASLIANASNYLLIIVIVELSQNYILALALNILVESAMNLWLNSYVNQKYPFLQRLRKDPLEKSVVSRIMGDIKNIFVSQIAAKVLISTDSLIMSGFISVGIVGLYSNYTMITQSITNIVEAFSNALQPSVGNMFIEGNHKKEHEVLRQINFIFFLGTSFATVSLITLMTPFVADVWLGREYALDLSIIFWCVLNFYTRTISMPLSMMMEVTGLFRKERNLSIAVVSANLVISLLLVVPFGVAGVLIGTFVSYMIQLVVRSYVLLKVYMGQTCRTYIWDLLQYTVVTIVEVGLVLGLKELLYLKGSFLEFFLMMVICVLLPNGLNLVLYGRSWRFKSCLQLMKRVLKRNEEVHE